MRLDGRNYIRSFLVNILSTAKSGIQIPVYNEGGGRFQNRMPYTIMSNVQRQPKSGLDGVQILSGVRRFVSGMVTSRTRNGFQVILQQTFKESSLSSHLLSYVSCRKGSGDFAIKAFTIAGFETEILLVDDDISFHEVFAFSHHESCASGDGRRP
jgi:hypothetical protein